jgi:YHS domain-containing protein
MNIMESTKNAEFDGNCAFAVSTGKTNIEGGTHSATFDGKTYLFSNSIAKLLFKILPNRIQKANQHWEKVGN